jgi:hypothetical protein
LRPGLQSFLEGYAQAIMGRAGIRRLPVPAALARYLIGLTPVGLVELQVGGRVLKGLTLREGRCEWTIMIGPQPVEERRFTLFHEAAHLRLALLPQYEPEDRVEGEEAADYLASLLILPPWLVAREPLALEADEEICRLLWKAPYHAYLRVRHLIVSEVRKASDIFY